jgi:hypothetical protein
LLSEAASKIVSGVIGSAKSKFFTPKVTVSILSPLITANDAPGTCELLKAVSRLVEMLTNTTLKAPNVLRHLGIQLYAA